MRLNAFKPSKQLLAATIRIWTSLEFSMRRLNIIIKLAKRAELSSNGSLATRGLQELAN